MSHYADYRKECYDIHSYEDENGFFAVKGFEDEKRLHIEDMWIKPEARDKKIGQEYQDRIFEKAKDIGYKKVSCSVCIDNEHANETLAKFLHNKWRLAWLTSDYIILIKDVL